MFFFFSLRSNKMNYQLLDFQTFLYHVSPSEIFLFFIYRTSEVNKKKWYSFLINNIKFISHKPLEKLVSKSAEVVFISCCHHFLTYIYYNWLKYYFKQITHFYDCQIVLEIAIELHVFDAPIIWNLNDKHGIHVANYGGSWRKIDNQEEKIIRTSN